jgi:predicted GNAT superfamily acetyltransferase
MTPPRRTSNVENDGTGTTAPAPQAPARDAPAPEAPARDAPAPDAAPDPWARPGAAEPARAAGRRLAEEAERLAVAAGDAASVVVREVRAIDELDAVHRLYNAIWRPDPQSPPMTGELLRALAKSGNYVGGAFDGDELVGACVGFFGAPAEEAVHSHIAGVSGAARGRSIGFALKLHQRAWSMRRGVSAITWTYDPLVRRNAYFNLVKLAARPEEYLANFYGGMRDGINGDDDTDRLLVHWRLGSDPVRAACAGRTEPADAAAERARGALVALAAGPDGGPQAGPARAAGGGGGASGPRTLLVAVPPDIEGMRLAEPGRAKDWRTALREVMGAAMADGARVTGFDRAGWYVLQHAGARTQEER